MFILKHEGKIVKPIS